MDLTIKLFIIRLNGKAIFVKIFDKVEEDIKIELESKYLSNEDITKISDFLYGYKEERIQKEIEYVREQGIWTLEGQVWQLIFPALSQYSLLVVKKEINIK